MYNIIYDLLQSKDLLEANSNLKRIDDALNSNDVDRSAFCKKMSHSILEWAVVRGSDLLFLLEKPKYSIIQSQFSIPSYLVTNGLALGKVRDLRKNIKKLIAAIDDTITKPSGNFLSVKKEEDILSVLTKKFPFWEVLSSSKPLLILNMNNSHRLFNSVCGTDDEAKTFVIYMFNMKDNTVVPEYVFLHELGHVLQIALTGSEKLVPEEFIQFNEALNKTNALKQGSYEAQEVFADTFAISVMHGTDLWRLEPFNFSDSLNETFVMFYTKLFEKYQYSRKE
ncbi:MAG: hypothetical protein FWH55_04975 [Oscillospiraceae bacterium]|nr:hypothetical protein [Oscillospiraceae bacterium]